MQRRDEEGASDVRRANRRVLVVDDDEDGREAVARFLQLKGHEVRIARNGREALELAAGFRPDVVLLDIAMPELDGYEVCSRLRGLPRTSEAAIFAMAGFGSAEHRIRATRAGFDGYLVKPLDFSLLLEMLVR